MKNKIVLFITGCISLLLSSCLGSDNNMDYEIAKNCQIATFKLKNDSVPGLSNVKFSVDQLSNRIFNVDSIPYGTEIEKLVCAVTYASTYGIAGVQVLQEAVGDTIWWNGSDSLNFSKPVKFITYSYDGLTTKTYFAQINIHQVVPDSMVWSLYSDKTLTLDAKEQKVVTANYNGSESYFMYVQPTSGKGYKLFYAPATNAKNWSELSLTGLPAEGLRISQITEYEGGLYASATNGMLYNSVNGQEWKVVENAPSVTSVLGKVNEGLRQSSALAAIINDNGTLKFAAMNKALQWNTGEIVPSEFPVNGFASTGYEAMYYQYLMVVAGKNSKNQLTNASWATMNATSWAMLSDIDASYFEKKEGAMLTTYDSKFFLIGGLNEAGKASKEIYTSIDNGVSWSLIDTMVVLPADYKARGFASVQVDKENYMYIFGGKTGANTNDLNQIWRGRINRLGFKD